MKKITFLLFIIFSALVSNAQSHRFKEAFGVDFRQSDRVKFNNSTSTPLITPMPVGNSGFTIMDLINRGAILIEERINSQIVYQRRYVISVGPVTTAMRTYWNIPTPTLITESDIVGTYSTNFRANNLIAANTYKQPMSIITNVNTDVAFPTNQRPTVTFSYSEYVTTNNGLSWSNSDFQSIGAIDFVSESTELLANLPTQFKSTDPDYFYTYRSYIENNWGDYREGTALIDSDNHPFGTYFSPAIANIGKNTITYDFRYWNGHFRTTKDVYVCNSVPIAPVITANGSTAICSGGTVTLTSNNPNVTWSNGQTGGSITVSAAGTYFAYENNACGSSGNSNSIIVSNEPIPTTPTISAIGSTLLCNGATVTLTATGSNITWSNGQTGNSITVTEAGAYYAFSSSGCGQSSNSNVITVTKVIAEKPINGYVTSHTNPTCSNAYGSITVVAGGQNVFYRMESLDGLPTTPEQESGTFNNIPSGMWKVYARSVNGTCISDDLLINTIEISNPPTPIPSTPTISASGATAICNFESVTLTATGSNITWSNGHTGNSITVTEAGAYYAFSSSSCGQSSNSNVINVTVASVPAAPLVIEGGSTTLCSGGTITLTANGSNVTWSNGQTGNSITVSTAGSYYAWDTNSCGSSDNSNIVTVTVINRPSSPNITAIGPTALCDGGTVILQASGSNITWSNGQTGNIIMVTSGGTYYAYSTNSCGPSPNSESITVTSENSPPAPTISATGSTDLCNGATVTLNATGSNITWSNGQTGNSITVSTAGNYYAYSTNSCGQSPDSESITVREVMNEVAPTITAIGSTSLCNGATVTLTATGSNITWSNGQTGNSITVSTAGNYYAYSTNSCGQSSNSNSIAITTDNTPSAPTITANSTTTLCNGATVILTATGSNITWSNGQTGNSITVSEAGNYYAYSTNTCGNSANSNTLLITTNITPAAPTITTSSTTLCNGATVTLTATGTNITWSNGETGNSITVSAAGTYYAFSYSLCGSSPHSNSITINNQSAPAAPTITASGTTSLCNGATVTLTATGTNITWSNGQTGNTIMVSTAGTYFAYATNDCGQSINSNSIAITTDNIPSAPSITASGITDLCNGATVTLTATGSNITWSNGLTGNSITVSAAGTYYAYSTSGCGQSTNSNVITVRAGTVNAPTISASATMIFANENVTLTSSIAGPIEWFRDGNSVFIGGNTLLTNTAGTYKAREINSIGCASDFSNEIIITKYSDETEIPVIKPPITPGVDIIDNGDGTSTMKFCTGLSFPLTAPLADSYKWFKNGVEIIGQTARIFLVSEAGNYTVQIVKNGNQYTTPILKVELYSLPNRPVINY